MGRFPAAAAGRILPIFRARTDAFAFPRLTFRRLLTTARAPNTRGALHRPPAATSILHYLSLMTLFTLVNALAAASIANARY